MKTNKYTGIGVLFLLALLVCPMISATTTIVAPVSNGNYTGTVDVNVTTDVANALNVTCLYNSSGGAATVSFIDIVNTTASQTVFTGTVTVSAYTDATTYNISCTATGDTTETATSVDGITIDNTDPVTTLEVVFGGLTVSSGSILDYKCSVADAIDSSTTNVFTVTDPDSSATSLSTDSTNFLNFVDTDTPGDYVFSCAGTDYAGNTETETSTVTIDELGRATITQTTSSSSNNNMLILLAVLGILAYLYFRK